MISARGGSFFITGGTLGHDAPCYVERRADAELLSALLEGEFCYVLTSRQMGKSSLMVRTAAKLRAADVDVVVLDLTMLGRNLTVEQWYYGLLGHAGQQLGLRRELREFWLQHPLLSPLQRWFSALREVVLPRCRRRLVIFIDEIDSVLNLPFSTDEFFAGVRECYNRRTQDPAMDQLTFCFLGVAAPADLMHEARTTPFNIGCRIELTDFNEAEAKPLAFGLALGELGVLGRSMDEARQLLRRVLYWTNGHPYLTQRLCQGVVSAPAVNGSVDVDRVCSELFLDEAARERDDNLIFVRERLLRSEVDLGAMLQLYARVLAGKRILEHSQPALISILRLAGVVNSEDGYLRPRNNIYSTVFDRHWAQGCVPDPAPSKPRDLVTPERLPRRIAHAALACALAALAGLAVFQTLQAEDRARELRLSRYVSGLSQAQSALEAGRLAGAAELLEQFRPRTSQEDVRGFEWNYLWNAAHPALATYSHPEPIHSVAFARDGQSLFTASPNLIWHWDRQSGTQQALQRFRNGIIHGSLQTPSPLATADGAVTYLREIPARGAQNAARTQFGVYRSQGLKTTYLPVGTIPPTGFTFSPHRNELAVWRKDPQSPAKTELEVWDFQQDTRLWKVAKPNTQSETLVFSRDGRLLAYAENDSSIQVREALTGQPGGTLRFPGRTIQTLTLSADGALIAVIHTPRQAARSSPPQLEIWSRSTPRLFRRVPLAGHISAVAFSPDNRMLALGTDEGRLVFLQVFDSKRPTQFLGHTGRIHDIDWSADSRVVGSAGEDHFVRIWDPKHEFGQETLSAHRGAVSGLSFAPDSRTMVTTGTDRRIRLWDTLSLQPLGELPSGKNAWSRYSGSPGRPPRLWTLTDGICRWQDQQTGATAALGPTPVQANVFSVSPDEKRAALSGPDGISLWDLRDGTSQRRVTETPVEAAEFAAKGTLLIGSTSNGNIRMWNTTTLAEVGQFPAGYGSCLAVSPSGELLAYSQDMEIRIRDLRTHREMRLQGHSAAVTALQFSPDGRTLISGDHGPRLRLWNVATGEPLLVWQTNLPGIRTLGVAPDGKTLIAGGTDGRLQVWRATPGEHARTELQARR